MESGQGVSRKGRKLASSRRRQTREPADGQDTPVALEPESWSSQADTELQGFFQDCGAKERGFVTREDLAEAKFSFLGGQEDPQMIFDWVDSEHRGRLSLEEFSCGLKNVFGSSLGTHRLRRTRPPPSQRVSVTASFPTLEEADSEEKEAFLALVGHLGSGHSLSEQAEIWQLWGKLRQEEPQLAGNLEGFLTKMRSHLQEARAEHEALERMLKKRDSDHHREVRRLYEETEEQIRREKQQLQVQSDFRGLALNTHMQEALEAKEREVQQLAEGQKELEAQLHYLSSSQQKANSEKQQLQEVERDLAGQLEEVRGQLQVTRGHLDAARGRVSWQIEEEPRISEKASNPEAASPEEAPLPGLFEDSDDWGQLLNSFSSPPHRTMQLTWSPPPTPKDTSGPQTPRIVRQISISSPPFGQEQASDPDAAPSSPSGVPSSTKDPKGVEDPNEQASSPKQPVQISHFLWNLPGLPAVESGSLETANFSVLLDSEAGFPPQEHSLPSQAPAGPSKQCQASDPDDKVPGAGLAPAKQPRQVEALPQDLHAVVSDPGLEFQGVITGPSQSLEPLGQVLIEEPVVQGEPVLVGKEGCPGGLQETHGQTLRMDGLPASSLQSLVEQFKAEEGNSMDRGLQELGSQQVTETHRLETECPESSQPDVWPAPSQSDKLWAPVEAETPALGKLTPLSGSPPMGAQPGAAAGLSESTQTHPTLAELEAQPMPLSVPVQAERVPDFSQSKGPGVESSPKDPGMDSGEARLTSSLRNPMASKPQIDPDYLFHVIFMGDSNVGKTSFLHLLHHDTFATGLTATVGVDFRVKSLLVDNKCFALQLWDTAGQERYHSLTRQLLRKADGVVLMYDVTSRESFVHVRYWLDCLQDAGADRPVIFLLGNKMDCEEKRQVPTEAGRCLAQELGVSFSECSAILGHNILEPMVNLARSLKIQDDLLKVSMVEVAPKKPPKRTSCCS